MKRTGPDNGYDFGRKRQYRRHVWGFLRRQCPAPKGRAQALLMPSIEGAEIEEALKRGFCEPNLHVVDRNPAIVAHLKRRFPKIHTYGVELSKAAQRMRGTVDVANLDLCSCMGDKLKNSLLGSTAALRRHSVVAVTMLRGRERRDALPFIDFMAKDKHELHEMDAVEYIGTVEPNDRDKGRVALAACLLAFSEDLDYMVRVLRWGIYRSSAGSQTMLWAIFERMQADLWADKAAALIEAEVRWQSRTGHGPRAGRLRWVGPQSWFGDELRGYPRLVYREFSGPYADKMREAMAKLAAFNRVPTLQTAQEWERTAWLRHEWVLQDGPLRRWSAAWQEGEHPQREARWTAQ